MTKKFHACTDCIIWLGAKTKGGYGLKYNSHGSDLIHRQAYENVKGKIPDGLELDHLCRNRACYNPEHLEAVTRKVNLSRGLINQNVRKTHCPYWHEYTKDNTYLYKGRRNCKKCGTRTFRRIKRLLGNGLIGK